MAALACVVVAAGGAAAAAPRRAGDAQRPSPTTAVSIPVELSAGRASARASVRAGDARFEVLGDGLIRLEYSAGGRFTDTPTVNVLRRRFAVPAFHARRVGGWLTITTPEATLRYRLGSGPFGPTNTFVQLRGGRPRAVTWRNACPFGQVCDAGAAALHGALLGVTLHGYRSLGGYIDGLAGGSEADWTVIGAPAEPAVVGLRYLAHSAAALALTSNGAAVARLPPSRTHGWVLARIRVRLRGGRDEVGVRCLSAPRCAVALDTLLVYRGARAPPLAPAPQPLGGYIRGLDTATYGARYRCQARTPVGPGCTAALPVLHPGILDRTGVSLLDDTASAVWTRDGWVAPRPRGGDLEDGYLFAYGHRFIRALEDLRRLTGPAPLLPESTFGVWYSEDYAYTVDSVENALVPAFRAAGVPLDTLSLDTDWKAPDRWNGWEWNAALFPDAPGFLSWLTSQGINVALNVHPSIAINDPNLTGAEQVAGGALPRYACAEGTCASWDWSRRTQADSFFALHQAREREGVSFWWLDWCCDPSTVSMPGLTPDDWINHLYAQDLTAKRQRGFVLARLGASQQSPQAAYPAGPWSAHTSTIAFTGDAWATWNTLAFESELAADEASVGVPYVSDDIGSFLGPPPGGPADTPDLYVRWVQLGALQPILRLHSDHGERLPWDYPPRAAQAAASFLRLREALVPYTYTLAAQAVGTGLPITRPLYLDYPDQPAAYDHPGEYLYGQDVLVAPVTTPGTLARRRLWLPPGQWTDWFTGKTFIGPLELTLAVPLERMPLFVKAGAIVPLQAPMSHVGADPQAPVTLRVYPGSPGRFWLYADAGTGLGYARGESERTPIVVQSGGGRSRAAPVTDVAVGPSVGSYPGEPHAQSFVVVVEGQGRPERVLFDGRALRGGWTYDAGARAVSVPISALPTDASATVRVVGG